MKKKRFYNNKKRNEKWTEPPKGRKINFADKYIESGNSSDKYDNRRKKEKKPLFTKEHLRSFAKYLIVALGCFVIVGTGYTLMDLYIERNAMPLNENDESVSTDMSNVALQLKSARIEPLSMDGGVMLEAVVDEVIDGGYTSVTFDIKRDDGTIGYDSALATIDMYGAEASPAIDVQNSIAQFVSNDILPVGRISCYKDNVVGASDLTAGLIVNGKLYRDSGDNAYLNPSSESAYNYIRGIVEESKGMGVTVFVLENCNLPEELGNSYGDGFKPLADKLYKDFGNDIKLIEGVAVTVNGDNAKSIEEEWKEKTASINSSNIIFNVTAKDKEKVKQFLDTQDGISYIISE
ncbi:MAG: putative glycoside hydrolase [Eubacterium sp.]|nr:putative glycoside hydrolase [Eubacterium sp.]